MGDKKRVLPPGFEFDPTDEELIVYFLSRRAANLPFYPNIIPDLDFYAANPWNLNDKAFWSKRKWYFFSEVKKNRCSRKGFWSEVGVNEPIFTSNGDHQVGIKIYLVYYTTNEDGSNVQTNWFMEEYHLFNYNHFIINNISTSSQNIQENRMQDMKEWVVCRVQEANYLVDFEDQKTNNGGDDEGVELSYLDEVFFSMEDDDQEEIISFPT